jgi:DnaJ domain
MVREGDTINLEHAYRVLDVPWDASPRVIKASYRKLVQRWHPDRYRPDSDAYTESTLMTKLLNDSYARIKNAPLRNGVADALSSEASPRSDRDTSGEPDPSGSSRSEYVPRDPNQEAAEYYRMVERARQAGARDDAARPFDWVGFFVRFVLGALFGAVLSFRVMIYLWLRSPRLIYIGIVTTILLCALASGFGGDAFWRAIRPGGLWWWRRWD